jgi:signal transduction histidine kinase
MISVVDEASDQNQFLLAALPPSREQNLLALGIVVLLVVAFVITVPFTTMQLPVVVAFIPALQTALLICDLITAALLFTQFTILRWRALLALASGYLFTALIVIPHSLTFPGVISPAGLFGAGPQSTAWLYIFWHVGLPLAVIVYALLKDADRTNAASEGTTVAAIGLSVAVVIGLVCGLTWIATTQEMLLPRILDDGGHLTIVAKFINGFLLLLGIVALALVWVRRRSVLDLWLMAVMFAFLIEIDLAAQFAGTRFSLGYYAGRFYSLITAAIVLILLLSETTTLHAHLALSVMRQRAAREARQIAMDAVAASIAHEVNQPLAAMVVNANAGLRWLTNKSPDLDEVHAALQRVVTAGHRAGDVVTSVRTMFKKSIHGREPVAVNGLVLDVLKMVDLDLRTHRISVSTDLRDGLPHLLADRGQLQQVFLNLITNSMDAMGSVTDRAHQLRIRSNTIEESSGILVTVEDTGTGIGGENKENIFEPFFTTKSAGTGIGLAICRSIIESHGGSIEASANDPYGMIFRISLPSTP